MVEYCMGLQRLAGSVIMDVHKSLLEQPSLVELAGNDQPSMLAATSAFETVFGGSPRAWSLSHYTIPGRVGGPPPHRHAQIDEAFYILDCTPSLQLSEDVIKATPGTYLFIPRGVV